MELFEKSPEAQDILPRSLLQLFVDAESYQMEMYDRFGTHCYDLCLASFLF